MILYINFNILLQNFVFCHLKMWIMLHYYLASQPTPHVQINLVTVFNSLVLCNKILKY